MNILHVLSQFELTGAEAYALTLAQEQIKDGNRVILVSDTLTLPLPPEATYIPMAIGIRSYRQRLRNIRGLCHLIRREGIQIVHAHSRAASWVSFFATRITGVAFVSTIHGKQHIHFSSRRYNIYGSHTIAVCENLRDHLIKDLHFNPTSLHMVRNPVLSRQWEPSPDDRPPANRISWVGRFSGPKGRIIRYLINEVMPLVHETHKCKLTVLGGNAIPGEVTAAVRRGNESAGLEVVVLEGFCQKVSSRLHDTDLVIGSGRVAMESLLLGKRLAAFGESGWLGEITPANFPQAVRSNFGDVDGELDLPPAETVAAEIAHLATHRPDNRTITALRALALQEYDSDVIYPRLTAIYSTAWKERYLPSFVPVLMYHRVVHQPPSGSRHGIWVTARAFENQMRSLHVRGMTPITFADCLAFLRCQRGLPRRPVILTFDDGYADTCEVALPIMQKWGAKGTVYVVTENQHRTNFWDPDEPQVPRLTAAQIRELHNHGMEIGSHTINHVSLLGLPYFDLERELTESKRELEQIIGSEVISFAYPYGKYDAAAGEAVAQAGYQFAVATDQGPLRFLQDPLDIRRIQVFPRTAKVEFWKKTQPWYSHWREVKHRRKHDGNNEGQTQRTVHGTGGVVPGQRSAVHGQTGQSHDRSIGTRFGRGGRLD